MIAELHLKNFKCFRELTLNTTNLTVLTGANGTGKTSVLHALLLARQIARHPDRAYVELNGVDTLELGGLRDVTYHASDESVVRIEVVSPKGKRWCWAFGGVASVEARTLYAPVVERASDYTGTLAQPSPRFCHLCAERLGPRDVLPASATNDLELDVGARGEFVAQVLEALERSRVRAGRIATSSDEGRVPTLLYQTERWMGEIVRPIQIETRWFGDTSVTRLRFKTPGLRTEWTRAPNTGFGIAHSLPIVVAGLRAKVGGLLLVENPEAHLHPAGQSKMGGFLAKVAADGVQVFLETHSDHVLNGIRVAVANGSAALTPEQTAIHFFRAENDGEPVLESIELRRTGQLSTWPVGFFDQERIDLAALALKRKQTK